MRPSAHSDAKRILDSIRRLVRTLRLYSREAETRLGLSAAQLFVLHELKGAGTLSLKGLAERTMTDVSSVSVVVERLVQKGLVSRKRSSKDARQLELALSNQGKTVLHHRPDALQSRLIKASAALKPAQRRCLAAGLENLLLAAGMAGETPAMLFENEGS